MKNLRKENHPQRMLGGKDLGVEGTESAQTKESATILITVP